MGSSKFEILLCFTLSDCLQAIPPLHKLKFCIAGEWLLCCVFFHHLPTRAETIRRAHDTIRYSAHDTIRSAIHFNDLRLLAEKQRLVMRACDQELLAAQ